MSGSSDSLVFSVVVPTLGRAQHLDGCLAALSRLDFPREGFEVVVVNDGGGETIDRLGSEWETQMALVQVSTAAAGPSAARNAGARAARGRFIAFTDDDCQPEPRWLQALQDALETSPGCAAGGRMVNGASGRCAAGSQAVLEAAYAHFNRDPMAPRFFATSNLAFPVEKLHRVGGFDEGFRHAEDRELCERWVRSGGRFVGAPLAVVRHMRKLTPREFWRQHFNYGRGAWAIQRARSERGWGEFKVEPGFYAELARQVRAPKDGAGHLSVAVLALTSQIANAGGFAREAFAARRARPERTSLQGVNE